MRADIRLGPRPGKKATTVAVPEYARRIAPPAASASTASSTRAGIADLDEESDDELERAEVAAFGMSLSRAVEAQALETAPAERLIDLDDEDDGSELEVEPPA